MVVSKLVMKAKPAKPRKVERVLPPPPPLVHRRKDGLLEKSKVVYSNGPRVKKLKDISSGWCGLPTYQSTVSCTLQAARVSAYADSITMAINAKTGRIGIAGSGFSRGKVLLYLWSCLYSHLVKLGTIDTDTMKWNRYGKHRVPVSFAMALQDLGTYTEPETKAKYTLHFPGLTEAYYDALSCTEGNTPCPVIVGNNASFGDEPQFGVGATIGPTSLTDTDYQLISELIGSAMTSVQTKFIATWAGSSSGFMSYCGNQVYRSVDRVSNVAPDLSLAIANVPVGICQISRSVPTYDDTADTTSSMIVDVHVELCMKLDYLYKEKVWGGFSKFGVDPYAVQVFSPTLSFSVFGGLILDWLINTGNYNANSGGTNTIFNNCLNFYYAYLISKTPFAGRMNRSDGQSPFYTTPSHSAIGAPTFLGDFGLALSRACNTIIVPRWADWSFGYNCMNTFYTGKVYTPTFDSSAGSLPLNGTVSSGVTIAGLAPPSTLNVYNACYLMLKEEIQDQLRSTVINGQTVEFDKNKPYCPCAISYAAGQNYDVVSFVSLPASGLMTCYRAVGAIACKANMGTCLDISPKLTNYYKNLGDVAQNRYRPVTEAAKFGNNVTQLIATNSGAAWKQALAGYTANLSSSIKWDKALVTGADLLKAANTYVNDGGELSLPPDASFWSNIVGKDHNLEELVQKVASGINYITPAVRTGLALYKAISVHHPIV